MNCNPMEIDTEIEIIDQDMMMEEVPTKKEYKRFKEYYQDAEWKKQHLDYMKTKIPCDCGKLIARSNMSSHKKTKLHAKRMDAMTEIDRNIYDLFYSTYMDLLKKIDPRLI